MHVWKNSTKVKRLSYPITSEGTRFIHMSSLVMLTLFTSLRSYWPGFSTVSFPGSFPLFTLLWFLNFVVSIVVQLMFNATLLAGWSEEAGSSKSSNIFRAVGIAQREMTIVWTCSGSGSEKVKKWNLWPIQAFLANRVAYGNFKRNKSESLHTH